jgi:hypothetical protein
LFALLVAQALADEQRRNRPVLADALERASAAEVAAHDANQLRKVPSTAFSITLPPPPLPPSPPSAAPHSRSQNRTDPTVRLQSKSTAKAQQSVSFTGTNALRPVPFLPQLRRSARPVDCAERVLNPNRSAVLCCHSGVLPVGPGRQR